MVILSISKEVSTVIGPALLVAAMENMENRAGSNKQQRVHCLLLGDDEDEGRRPYCLPNLARKSLLVLGWAFCCGIFVVIWYMINFSLWIAGAYLSVVTIQKLRQPEAFPASASNEVSS